MLITRLLLDGRIMSAVHLSIILVLCFCKRLLPVLFVLRQACLSAQSARQGLERREKYFYGGGISLNQIRSRMKQPKIAIVEELGGQEFMMKWIYTYELKCDLALWHGFLVKPMGQEI